MDRVEVYGVQRLVGLVYEGYSICIMETETEQKEKKEGSAPSQFWGLTFRSVFLLVTCSKDCGVFGNVARQPGPKKEAKITPWKRQDSGYRQRNGMIQGENSSR